MGGDDSAIVVGSGPNGLAAGIRLAEAGLPVTVLEANDVPGGAVRTEELTLPGFRHDTFSSVFPAGAASPVFARMQLERHGLEWVHPACCCAHPLPDGGGIGLYRDLEATAASLDAHHPGDGRRWSAFARPLVEGFDAVLAAMLGGFDPLATARRSLAALGPVGTAQLAALLPRSAEVLAHRIFEGSGSRAWLYGSATHGDIPPSAAGSAIVGTYLKVLGHAVGWPSPVGGAQALTDALVGRLKELGGTVRTGSCVDLVEVRHGRVSGVLVNGGERVATRLVVADVMPSGLIAMAGRSLPATYSSLLRRFSYGPPTVKLDWALAGPIPWLSPVAREAGTVHVAGDEADLCAALAAASRGLPERPFLLLGQQSIADPSRAPDGKHTAWAYTRGPRETDWARELPRYTERIEAHVERYAPGFRDLILARHVLGPHELEARNRNLIGGDVGGGSYRLRQVVFRPVPGLSPYRTPVAGLYIGSAAAFPGGAVHGVPGDAAARAAIADLRSRKRARAGSGGR